MDADAKKSNVVAVDSRSLKYFLFLKLISKDYVVT